MAIVHLIGCDDLNQLSSQLKSVKVGVFLRPKKRHRPATDILASLSRSKL